MKAGSIYICTNASMPNHVKIGASDDPSRRAQQLSQLTAIPVPFTVIFSQPVLDMHGVEARIFRVLRDYRSNHKREFFHLHPVDAVRIVRTIIVETRLNKPERVLGKGRLGRIYAFVRYESLMRELREAAPPGERLRIVLEAIRVRQHDNELLARYSDETGNP